jgi:tetratricopeptide (TPR) repeat protein
VKKVCLGTVILVGILAACSSDPRRLLAQAEARWREGKYEDAIRLNTLVYNRERGGVDGATALLNIGNIYYLNLRRLKDAIDTYNKLVDEYRGSPEERKAREQLAAIYANEIGDLTQAISEYDRILELPGLQNRQEIEFLRAKAHFQNGEYNVALQGLRHLEEEGVAGHLAHQVSLKIGNIYQIQKKYEQAGSCFQRVMDSPCIDCRRRAHLYLMETYEALFDFERAIAVIRSLDASPENRPVIAREIARLNERQSEVEAGRMPRPPEGRRR